MAGEACLCRQGGFRSSSAELAFLRDDEEMRSTWKRWQRRLELEFAPTEARAADGG